MCVCVPPKVGRVGRKLSRESENAQWHDQGLHSLQEAAAAPGPPALAHVDGVEDPLRELLQLVGGVLGLLLQPQVVLAQVLDFCLKVGFVFFFLRQREKD